MRVRVRRLDHVVEGQYNRLVNRSAALIALVLSSVVLAQPVRTVAADDRALLHAVLAVHAPAPEEIRVIAIEDLGLLGDPRALDVLGSLLRDRGAVIPLAALRAVRAFRTPRAEELLTSVVRDREAPEALKQGALEALAFQGSASSRAFLAEVRGDAAYGPRLQGTAKAVLERLAAR